MTARLRREGTLIMPASGGTGTVHVTARSGVRPVAESSAPVPVPPSPSDRQALIDRLSQAHLELSAWPGAVTCARHHARQLLWDWGLKELIEPVELVVSEIVTNAVRASGGLDGTKPATGEPLPVVCLWLTTEQNGVLVLVSDSNPSLPERQEPGLDDDSGRGLLLVELLSAAWGSFELVHKPGKVVWALCRS
jgi:anti-sigma regulatory factor (Ser/Thr protein kinase)